MRTFIVTTKFKRRSDGKVITRRKKIRGKNVLAAALDTFDMLDLMVEWNLDYVEGSYDIKEVYEKPEFIFLPFTWRN